jgi:hypothetical protein
MDDFIGKHLTKCLKIDSQRTMANIHVGGIENFFLDVFIGLSIIKE